MEACGHDPYSSGSASAFDASGAGVFLLAGDAIRWRPIKAGTSSISRVQIAEGLAEGDAVALPTDFALRDGERVRAVYP